MFILTNGLREGQKRFDVVDGQQRILTLSLLATAIYFEAKKAKRTGTANEIEQKFLKRINRETDQFENRLKLTSNRDNTTLEFIIENGYAPDIEDMSDVESEQIGISDKIVESYRHLKRLLGNSLTDDNRFKEIGEWSEFLQDRISLSMFVHPEPSAAYKVFEVINTRGKSLTTADLIKNHLISESDDDKKESVYQRWVSISRDISENTDVTFVQYIRHVLALEKGKILPTQLFDEIKSDIERASDTNQKIDEFLSTLEELRPLYLYIANPRKYKIKDDLNYESLVSFNDLSILAIRPILLAIIRNNHDKDLLDLVLKMVISRVVTGNFGTGTVENTLFELARTVNFDGLDIFIEEIGALTKSRREFIDGLKKRNLNKSLLTFLNKSYVSSLKTPVLDNLHLHFVALKKDLAEWCENEEEELLMSKEAGLIGNTYLSSIIRRPKGLCSWDYFKKSEIVANNDINKYGLEDSIKDYDIWDADLITRRTEFISQSLANIWFED